MKINACYNEDRVIDDNLVSKNFYCLDKVIKKNTKDEKFIP